MLYNMVVNRGNVNEREVEIIKMRAYLTRRIYGENHLKCAYN